MKKIRLWAFLMAFCLILPTLALSVAADSSLLGDANGDGVVDIRDVIAVRRYLADLDYDTGESSVEININADMNHDGAIKLRDLYLLRYFVVNGSIEDEEFPEDTLVVRASRVEGRVGDEVTVTFTVESNPGFAAMRWRIPSVRGVEFVKAKRGSIVDGFTAGSSGNLFLWDASSNSVKTGTVMTVTYRITSDARVGDITLNVTVLECWNESYGAVKHDVEPIVIKVIE
jgi:hypothetical protein